MIELERVYDPVRLSALRAVLADAGIETFTLDASVGVLLGMSQTRLMVPDDDIEMARHVLEQAGLGPE